MEELVSARIFFSLASGAGTIFRAVYAFFLAIHVAWGFFLLQRLCRKFFLKSSTPPLKDQMVHH